MVRGINKTENPIPPTFCKTLNFSLLIRINAIIINTKKINPVTMKIQSNVSMFFIYYERITYLKNVLNYFGQMNNKQKNTGKQEFGFENKQFTLLI